MDLETTDTEKEPKSKKRLKQLQRTFLGDDADFIEKNRTIRLVVLPQLTAFTAFDPALDTAFTDAWLLQIQTCEAHPPDHVLVNDIENCTQNLQTNIAEVLKLVNDLEYYTKKAFPANPALWQEFGFAHRHRIQARTPGFLVWLYIMHRVLKDYETDLLAVGMPATFETDFLNACDHTTETEMRQEYAKRLRLRQTRLRVQQLNQLHTTLQRIQKAGAAIFYNNETKRKELE